MLVYWLNGRLFGDGPGGYHAINLIHLLNTSFVFLVLQKIVRSRGSALGGVFIFLIHPLQTESVSYIAGRSESLAATFVLAAYVVFLYRRDAEISWRESTIVLVLFALGVATKENAVALAGVLVLTDWRSGSLQKNWRLYAADGVRGRSLPPPYSACSLTPGQPDSASPPTGYEYAFTQARAIWVYLRMALLPFGQSLDHDFTASRTIRQNGAIFGLAAILALIAIAVLWRRRYPLASLGILMFLVWLAPTSIVIPIDDALIERRMYFPLLGLVIADCEVARRWRPAWAGAVLVFMLASRLWGRTLACLGQPSADWKNWNKPPECTRARRWISRLVW